MSCTKCSNIKPPEDIPVTRQLPKWSISFFLYFFIKYQICDYTGGCTVQLGYFISTCCHKAPLLVSTLTSLFIALYPK